jgi:HEAT repeat protein
LREHGIDTSETALIAALSNSDPVVRSTAAHQLLAEHDYLARPAIEKALSAETDSVAKTGIASALVGMGDPVGARTLESMCADASLPWDVTIRVVGQITMSRLSHPNLVSAGVCADVVLTALESTSDDYERTELVSVLPSIYKDVSKDKADRMITDAQKLLGERQAATRMQASMALTNMGSTASIKLIHAAMDSETDPNIRAVHQRNLDTLLKLQQPSSPAAPANPTH